MTPTNAKPRFTRVTLQRFKAFEDFTLHLRQFNILVGPNNAGKSTVLTAFRILAAAMRAANATSPKRVKGPNGYVPGYLIDLSSISVAEENIFFDYDESEPATITFSLSNQNKLVLYFSERGSCVLVPDAQGIIIKRPTDYKREFSCSIGFVPILGPVEHNERLYQREAARLALYSYTAARNFRNIWYHYPERPAEFRSALKETWPGMDIEPPEIDRTHDKPILHMFCPEERIPRELFWAGFGFQVWCQMLTHLIQSKDVSLFLIDEPDIYLHSDLQRQLLGLLRNLGPDILIATHSTEIISDAETDDIVLVDKRRSSAHRIKQSAQIGEVFGVLGSNLNPILTQLAKTRRAVFVEGKDFLVLAKFARRLREAAVANRSAFAVIPIGGFNPERVRSIKTGIEATLGGKIATALILDRDYRSDAECGVIVKNCEVFCDIVNILNRKELENYLLIPEAMDRAAEHKVLEQSKRSGRNIEYKMQAAHFLETYATGKRDYVTAQYLKFRRKFAKSVNPQLDEASITETALSEFTKVWSVPSACIPGKDALHVFNDKLQALYGTNLTSTAIIDGMQIDEIPPDIKDLVRSLSQFSARQTQ